MAIVKKIFFQIYFSGNSLLTYMSVIDIYVFILYLATLLNWFISSSCLWWSLKVFYILYRNICKQKLFDLLFSDLDVFYFFLLYLISLTITSSKMLYPQWIYMSCSWSQRKSSQYFTIEYDDLTLLDYDYDFAIFSFVFSNIS